MSMSPRLCEESKFILQFDEGMSTRPTIYEMELGWGDDPMEMLMRKQEQERDELMAYLAEHTH